MELATPPGWKFEQSLSSTFTFVPSGEEKHRLVFLRKENGTDVYRDLATGKDVYIGRRVR
jgi:hypothetical protein